MLEPATWLKALKKARAVAVPMLSLNTLSKLSMLLADNTATNIVLHALLMGKPVVAARNGADPRDKGREGLGFHRGNLFEQGHFSTTTDCRGLRLHTDRCRTYSANPVIRCIK